MLLSPSGAADFDTTLIGNSIWLDGSADFLKRTFGGASNQKRFVLGTWIQRNLISSGTLQTIFNTAGGGTGGNDGFFMQYENATSGRDDKINTYNISDGALDFNIQTLARSRDVNYYHILLSYESAAAETSRVQIFINGILQTALTIASYPSSGFDADWGTAESHCIGSEDHGTDRPLPAYLTQTIYLDGKSIQNSDVAVTDFLDSFAYGLNGAQFVPKADASVAALASTAGGNSFCLDFANSSDLGNDISSNNNDFTPTSMAAANQSGNTPSNVYPTINVLGQAGTGLGTLSEGNTKSAMSPDNGLTITQPLPSTGLWYWEMDWTAGANGIYPGICTQDAVSFLTQSAGVNRSVWVWQTGDPTGRLYNGPDTSVPVWIGSAVSVGKIAVAWDSDNTAMYFGTISGTTITWLDSGDPTSGASKTGAVPFASVPTDETIFIYGSVGGAATFQYLFDEDDWTGATNRPAAALALSSANLPTPEFQGVDYFKPVLYTGNGTAIGSGGKAVTGVGFKPDWTWIKNRDATDSHALYDIVRGVTKQLESDNTAVETAETEGLTIFGSDGFTVGNQVQVNTNAEDYVSWNWLGNNATESISASGANPTLASTNTASDNGSFGICTYTGDGTAGSTVKHSLGGVPDMIMFKRFGATTTNWVVYFKVLGATNNDNLFLDVTLAKGGAGAIAWLNATAATSTLVTLGDDGNTNASDTFIMYLFRNVPGVCKVGSYIGNGNAAGTYVSVGFLPRWIMIKKSSGAGSWIIYDTARSPINEVDDQLVAESTAVETTGSEELDILADGFKIRTADAGVNTSTGTYVYMAMADIGGGGTLPPIYGH